MSGRQVLETPCKINLFLGIHSERDARGYHRADSVMYPVPLYDCVTIDDAPSLLVSYEPALQMPVEKTAAYRAASLLAGVLGIRPDVAIAIECSIPGRGGLGSSSADAGATLRLLAARWGVSTDDPRVIGVARRVGADVPFFLDPRPSYLSGAGDILEATFDLLDDLSLVLVMPRELGDGGNTAACYAEFDRLPEIPADPSHICRALREGSIAHVAEALSNNLAAAAIRLAPVVGEVAKWLAAQSGVISSQVTGSGACCFAICADQAAADAIAGDARARGWWSKAVFSVGNEGFIC